MLKQFTKAERGWIMYDWANSAFSAIIAAIILPVLSMFVIGMVLFCLVPKNMDKIEG